MRQALVILNMADELWIVVELGVVRYDDLQAPKTRR
jgi:hypothetical protein